MKTTVILFVVGCFLLGGAQWSFADKTSRPNIIFLLSDDQAWTDYGFMGHPEIKTPHLDKLASESLVFRRGYLAASVCRPSLASMVTGLHPFEHGFTGNDIRLHAKNRDELDRPLREKFYQHPGFIELLTSNGYLAHQSGKWWEGSWKDGGFTHGMKIKGRHGSKESLAIGREGLEPVTDFIDMAVEQEQPFFLWYGVFLPHTPHNPPARLLNKYQQKGRAMDVAKYYAMCQWMDETCGDLLAYLDQKGALENTLIIRCHGNDTTKYKLTHNWDKASVRLYNLVEDPHETNERASQRPEVVSRLKAKIKAWHCVER